MTRVTLFCGFALLSVFGCSASDNVSGISNDANMSLARTDERREGEFLAYEHSITVDTSENLLAESHAALVAACAADRENTCTVLNSDISHGGYSSASIRMRVNDRSLRRKFWSPCAISSCGTSLPVCRTRSDQFDTNSLRVSDQKGLRIGESRNLASDECAETSTYV